MLTFWRRFLQDEEFFESVLRMLGGFACTTLGYLLHAGVIPTGIDDGGKALGAVLPFLAPLFSARVSGVPRSPRE